MGSGAIDATTGIVVAGNTFSANSASVGAAIMNRNWTTSMNSTYVNNVANISGWRNSVSKEIIGVPTTHSQATQRQ